MQALPHRYRVKGAGRTTGDVELTAERLTMIRSASPAEFDGPGDRWSPETLRRGRRLLDPDVPCGREGLEIVLDIARLRCNGHTRSARPSPAQAPTANGRDIARRAYELYLARGCDAGHDVEDWLQAERELQETVGSAGV
jgi:hypothetical protein